MKINNYREDLKYSDSCSDKINLFTQMKLSKFYKIKNIVSVKEKKLQFAGVDKILTTMNGSIIRIEEKIRRVTRNDILVELLADTEQYLKSPRGLGWGLKDYSTDILIYYFEDTNTGWLFGWNKFQKALFKNLPIWFKLAKENKKGFSFKYAYNKGYKSKNIVIPSKHFLKAYEEAGGVII